MNQDNNNNNNKRLLPQDLIKECDPNIFGFETTADTQGNLVTIGQDRALRAIDFGLNIKNDNFNMYISGTPGTGRGTTIIDEVNKLAASEPIPQDICYINNFRNPDEPTSLELSAGIGCQFKKDIEKLIENLGSEIQRAFTTEQYEKNKESIKDELESERAETETGLQTFANEREMGIQRTLTDLVVVAHHNGRPMTLEEYDKLPHEKKEEINRKRKEVTEKINEYTSKVSSLQREYKEKIEELNKKVVLAATGELLNEIKNKYQSYEEIIKHIDNIQDDIIENLDVLIREDEAQASPFFSVRGSKEDVYNKYRVNLLIDNCNTKGAPVVFEQNPTYYNLIGYIEYRVRFGALSTDFSKIKAGAVHKANGGYLIVEASQLLRDYYAWDSLKKVMKYKEVKIEDITQRYGFSPTTGLKPQAVPVNVKVIIIGTPMIYQLLHYYDEDFERLFKVKADFDTATKKTDDILRQYASFISQKCNDEKLTPFSKNAVAQIINYSSRLVSHQEKLSTRFADIVDVMKSADYWGRKENAQTIEEQHVKQALKEKIYRSNMIEEKIQEMIRENTIMIGVEGTKTGEINGLSVLSVGDYSFGMPSRITANTYLGDGSILNIEREVKMSGKIHSKGILILSGYIDYKYGQDKPLSLKASICFEQSYEGIDGDSASSTELYCILSSLSDLPLRQDIAVTGSVNQKGEVQAIGGANQKIEGFFEICKIKGLSGNQGVMIPAENIKHLMLKDEVINAVKENKFHIYAVRTIDEGIEILTGKKSGVMQADGSYPEGSVNQLVNAKLTKYAMITKSFGKDIKDS